MGESKSIHKRYLLSTLGKSFEYRVYREIEYIGGHRATTTWLSDNMMPTLVCEDCNSCGPGVAILE